MKVLVSALRTLPFPRGIEKRFSKHKKKLTTNPEIRIQIYVQNWFIERDKFGLLQKYIKLLSVVRKYKFLSLSLDGNPFKDPIQMSNWSRG